jgi:hypothetical protein
LQVRWELTITLPTTYPQHSGADFYLQCPNLTRDAQRRANEDLRSFLDSVKGQDPYVYSAAVWVQDHVEELSKSTQSPSDNVVKASPVRSADKRPEKLARFWIYSHHIYNKFKRKEILDTARDLALTGFSLPGKPGIICVEGGREDCVDFWTRIRSLNWQKIVLKNEEDRVEERAFEHFEELCLVGDGKRAGRGFHMDMGLFSKFLEEHGCGYAFKDYFGFDPAAKMGEK